MKYAMKGRLTLNEHCAIEYTVQVGLAMAFAQSGQLERSIPEFERAIFLNPPNVHEVHYNLAYTYQNMGRYKEALQQFKEVCVWDMQTDGWLQSWQEFVANHG